jgi:hypothetical protein
VERKQNHLSSLRWPRDVTDLFCDSWIPTSLYFFQDYWAEVHILLDAVNYDSL